MEPLEEPWKTWKRWNGLDIPVRKVASHAIVICKIVDFAVPADHRIILKESEKKDKYLDLAKIEKAVEHKSNDCANCDWCIRHNN